MAMHLGPYPHYPVLSSRSPLAFHLEEHKDGMALSWELQRCCARHQSDISHWLSRVHHTCVTLLSHASTLAKLIQHSCKHYWSGNSLYMETADPWNTQSMCHSITRWDRYAIALQFPCNARWYFASSRPDS